MKFNYENITTTSVYGMWAKSKNEDNRLTFTAISVVLIPLLLTLNMYLLTGYTPSIKINRNSAKSSSSYYTLCFLEATGL